MLKQERFQMMLTLLEEREFMTVQELGEVLKISMPTVRRDLTELAAQSKLIRSHGGAMRLNKNSIVPPLDFRRGVNAKEKAAIAKAATRFVRSESVIFVDASTTAAYLFDYLPEFPNLIVVTNSLMAAMRLKNLGVRTYCLGGEVAFNSGAVGGQIAMSAAACFNIDVMFFSSFGVNEKGVIVDPSEPENELRRHLMGQAETTVFLCDKSKFGKSAVFNLAPLDEVDYLVTDGAVPAYCPKPRRETLIV